VLVVVAGEFPGQECEGIRFAIVGCAERGLHGRLQVGGPQAGSGQLVAEPLDRPQECGGIGDYRCDGSAAVRARSDAGEARQVRGYRVQVDRRAGLAVAWI